MIRMIFDFLTGGDPTWDPATGALGLLVSHILTAILDILYRLSEVTFPWNGGADW